MSPNERCTLVLREVLETEFQDVVHQHPELLAHHCTEAGIIERAASLWGSAGQRSLGRSALIKAAVQLFQSTPTRSPLCRAPPPCAPSRSSFKSLLINPLIATLKVTALRKRRRRAERAGLLIEDAKSRGELSPEDPQLLFSVLHGFAMVNLVTFNGKALRELAQRFLALAHAQSSIVPLMVGHRIMGHSRLFTGDIAESRVHYDGSIALLRWREAAP